MGDQQPIIATHVIPTTLYPNTLDSLEICIFKENNYFGPTGYTGVTSLQV